MGGWDLKYKNIISLYYVIKNVYYSYTFVKYEIIILRQYFKLLQVLYTKLIKKKEIEWLDKIKFSVGIYRRVIYYYITFVLYKFDILYTNIVL